MVELWKNQKSAGDTAAALTKQILEIINLEKSQVHALIEYQALLFTDHKSKARGTTSLGNSMNFTQYFTRICMTASAFHSSFAFASIGSCSVNRRSVLSYYKIKSKQQAVQKVEKIINGDLYLLEFVEGANSDVFIRCDKKDDLADCLLLALWWLDHH
jgi:hypothetical protein